MIWVLHARWSNISNELSKKHIWIIVFVNKLAKANYTLEFFDSLLVLVLPIKRLYKVLFR